MQASKKTIFGPICIVGSVHTGTSLLRNVLDLHPDLYMVQGESHFFENLWRIERSYADLNNEETLERFVDFVLKIAKFGAIKAAFKYLEYTIDDIGVSRDDFNFLVMNARRAVYANPEFTHAAAFRAAMNGLAKLSGKNRWGEKTPAHVFFIDSIVAAMPDVRIIELVRDPRGVLASRKARSTEQWRSDRAASGAIMNEPVVFDPTLDSYKWRSVIRAGTRAKHNYPGSVLRVRYEDLVQKPTRTIERICRFINIRFDAQMLKVSWVNSATSIAEPSDSRGIGTAAMEKWRDSLSEGEIGLAQVILRREMAIFGYLPIDVGIRGLCEVPAIIGRCIISIFLHLKGLGTSRKIMHSQWDRVKRIIKLLINR